MKTIQQLAYNPIDGSYALSILDLSALSSPRQANVLREWLRGMGYDLPSRAFMIQVLEVLDSSPSSKTILQEAGLQIRFYDNYLYLLASQAASKQSLALEWPDINQQIALYDGALKVNARQKLCALVAGEHQVKLMLLTPQNISNGKALAGHSVNLKKWFQGLRVPTWRRSNTAILCLVNDHSQTLITAIDPQIQNAWVQIKDPNISPHNLPYKR